MRRHEDPPTSDTAEANRVAAQPAQRRAPVRRTVTWLIVATVALAIFILVLGDVRRKRNALSQAAWYARELSNRLGESRTLPLNLDIDVALAHEAKLQAFEWLTREEARRLRGEQRRIIVAWTREIRQILASNGRAVVFFQSGTFQPEWVTLAEFERFRAARDDDLDRNQPGAVGNQPGATGNRSREP